MIAQFCCISSYVSFFLGLLILLSKRYYFVCVLFFLFALGLFFLLSKKKCCFVIFVFSWFVLSVVEEVLFCVFCLLSVCSFCCRRRSVVFVLSGHIIRHF